MDLSIIVVSWNTRELLRQCLDSVVETVHDLAYEVIVVDNGSADGSADMVRDAYPWVRVMANRENRGFAGANNQAFQISCGRHVLLLNSDAVLLPEAAARLVLHLDGEPRAGAAGAQLLNPDDSFQFSYADFPSLVGETLLATRLSRLLLPTSFPSYPAASSQRDRDVDWVSGACLMVRRAAIDQVGLLDEDYFMYTEETDWCFRLAKAGWRIGYVASARVRHHAGQSSHRAPERRRGQIYRSKLRFLRKHRGALAGAAFRLVVLGTSYAKLAAWNLAGLLGDDARRQGARLQARSYAALLNDL